MVRSVGLAGGRRGGRDRARPGGIRQGFVDLHPKSEPGFEDAGTRGLGLGGGPPASHDGLRDAQYLAANRRGERPRPGPRCCGPVGWPVEVLAYGAVSAGRAGETLAALGELADGGAIRLRDDRRRVRSPTMVRNALVYAGMLGRVVVDHPEDQVLTEGAEGRPQDCVAGP